MSTSHCLPNSLLVSVGSIIEWPARFSARWCKRWLNWVLVSSVFVSNLCILAVNLWHVLCCLLLAAFRVILSKVIVCLAVSNSAGQPPKWRVVCWVVCQSSLLTYTLALSGNSMSKSVSGEERKGKSGYINVRLKADYMSQAYLPHGTVQTQTNPP